MFTCCFKSSSNLVTPTPTTTKTTKTKTTKLTQKEIDYYDFLAPSVYHLQSTFLTQIKDEQGLSIDDATLYDIEDLRNVDKPGLIRKKGLDVECPIDGNLGCAYVHTLKGDDHVGSATHML